MSRPWGTRYRIEGTSQSQAVKAIEAATRELSNGNIIAKERGNETKITGPCSGPLNLPRKIAWSLKAYSSDQVIAYYEIPLHAPIRLLLLIILLSSVGVFTWSIPRVFVPELSIIGLILFVSALAAVHTCLYVLSAEKHELIIFDRLDSILRQQGVMLHREPNGHRRRIIREMITTVLCLAIGGTLSLAALSPLFSGGKTSPFEIVLLSGIGLALLNLIAGCTILLLAACREGSADRIAPASPALFLIIGSLLILASQLSGILPGRFDYEIWDGIFELVSHLDSGADPITVSSGVEVSRSMILEFMTKLYVILNILFWMAVILVISGVYFLWRSIYSADYIVKQSLKWRNQMQEDLDYRSSTAERGNLTGYRITMLTAWASFTVLLGTGIIGILNHSKNSLLFLCSQENPPSSPVGPAIGWANMFSFLLEVEPGIVRILVSILWLLVGIAVVVFFVVILLRSVHGIRRRAIEDKSFIAERILKHARHVEAGHLNTIVVLDRFPFATATRTGFFGAKPSIVISDRLIDILDSEELDTVLAHEVAHHALGHSWRHFILHTLGHITFVGSGFVGTLENSFNYEIAADRYAISHLGCRPDTLRYALLKIRAATLIEVMAKTSDGLPFNGDTTLDNIKIGLADRLRIWWMIYFQDTYLTYCHPSLNERLEYLSGLQEQHTLQSSC